MKRLISLLAVGLAGFTPAPADAQTNLFSNPGFNVRYQQTGGAVYWELFPGSGTSATRSLDPNIKTEGAYSQRITVSQAGVHCLFIQKRTLTAGKLYQAKFKVRSDGVQPVRVQFLIRKEHAYYDAVVAFSKTISGTQWQQFELRGGYGATTPVYVGLNILSTGTIWVDEAELYDATALTFSDPPPSEPIPGEAFGIHINKLGHHNYWPPMSQRLVRLWDTGTRWMDLKPTAAAPWDFTVNPAFRMTYHIDDYIRKNNPACAIIYTLGQTPQWASQQPSATIPNPDYPAESSNPLLQVYQTYPPSPANDWDTWRDYVWNVAAEFNGKVKYWEIWNEWNAGSNTSAGFYRGTPQEMVELARTAREELKAVNASNQILAPNITVEGVQRLDDFLYHGGGNYVDIFTYHRYFGAVEDPPEAVVPEFEGLKWTLRQYGQNAKPLWNTEGAGFRDGLGSEDPGAYGLVARLFLVQWAQGLTNFNWYAFDIHRPGAVTLGNGITNPTALVTGGIAYREIVSWLRLATMTSRTVNDTTWTVTITRPGGYIGRIVWDTAGSRSFTIPSSWGNVRWRDLLGNRTLQSAGTVTIGRAPLLFENQHRLRRYEAEELEVAAVTPSGGISCFAEGAAYEGAARALNATAVGHSMTLAVPSVPAGSYDIEVRFKKGPTRGTCQLATASNLAGPYALNAHGAITDLYASTYYYVITTLKNSGASASVTFPTSGTKYFRFSVSSQNPASNGHQIIVDSLALVPVVP